MRSSREERKRESENEKSRVLTEVSKYRRAPLMARSLSPLHFRIFLRWILGSFFIGVYSSLVLALFWTHGMGLLWVVWYHMRFCVFWRAIFSPFVEFFPSNVSGRSESVMIALPAEIPNPSIKILPHWPRAGQLIPNFFTSSKENGINYPVPSYKREH